MTCWYMDRTARERAHKRYWRLRDAGRCVQCGQRPATTVALCNECRQYRKLWTVMHVAD